MKIPKLTPRLMKIYDIVPPCRTVCDIGTDHAYIPVCLTLSQKCQTAIASDIRKGPVDRAAATIKAYGANNAVQIRLGSGLETVKPNEAQTIIIAGMGGILISDILNASEKTAKSAQTLILQPMTAVSKLRNYLNQNGYTITKEYPVCEENKIYIIISAIPQNDVPYTKAELYMGREVEKNEFFEAYRQSRLKKLEKRIKGLSLSENAENKEKFYSLLKLKEMIENENL